MEIKVENCDRKHFLETTTRNRVSKMAGLFGSQNIVLSGKVFVGPTCVIRGDLAHVRVGKYSMIRDGTILRPSLKHFNKGVAFVPLTIGEHCLIEENVVVSAAQIGSFVNIGKNAVIGKRAVIKECTVILPDAVLAPDTVVPPFAIFGGAPARPVGKVPDNHQEAITELTTTFYQNTKVEDFGKGK